MHLKASFIFYIGLLSLHAIAGPAYAISPPNCYQSDWYEDSCPENLCQGYYFEPDFSLYDPLDPNLHITSSQSDFSAKGAHFKGEVQIQKGQQWLFANKAHVTRNPSTDKIETIQAIGDICYLEPDLKLQGKVLLFDLPTETKTLLDANLHYYPRHARSQAKQAHAFQKHWITLDEVTYTTCAPSENTWMLKAKKIQLDRQKNRGKAHHARLYFKGIPVAYTPYLSFALDNSRKSGFLSPDLRYASRSGFFVAAPWYWHIAPNLDTTLTPHVYQKRGVGLKTESRYLFPHHNGQLDFHFLPNDRAYQQCRADKDPRVLGLQRKNRYALHLVHQLHWNCHWQGNLDYATVSDDNYLTDFGNRLTHANTSALLQRASVDTYYSPFLIHSKVQRYETLFPVQGVIGTPTYRLTPQITLETDPLQAKNFIFHGEGQFTQFDHKNRLAFPQGLRFFFKPSVIYPVVHQQYEITPSIKGFFLHYDLKTQTTQNNHHTLALPIFDLNATATFERPIQAFGQDYQQTFEPRVYYLYIPNRSQTHLPLFDTRTRHFERVQLFQDNRYVGYDRLGNSNQITLGLTSRLLANDTGEEKCHWTVGQQYYIASQTMDPRLPALEHNKHASPVIAELEWLTHPHWTLHTGLKWDLPKHKLSQTSAEWEYFNPNTTFIATLGYHFLSKNRLSVNALHQAEAGISIALNPRMRLSVKHMHDIQYNQSLRSLLGFEYQSCCFAWRAYMTRFLQPNSVITRRKAEYGVGIQFVFKGFTSVDYQGVQNQLQTEFPDYPLRDKF